MSDEMFWKEAVALTMITIFSFTFYFRIDKPSLYIGFILLGLVFYFITVAEEKKTKDEKKLKNYFEHTSSFFVASVAFFALSYVLLEYAVRELLMVALAIAVILFSVGFSRLVYSRIEE